MSTTISQTIAIGIPLSKFYKATEVTTSLPVYDRRGKFMGEKDIEKSFQVTTWLKKNKKEGQFSSLEHLAQSGGFFEIPEISSVGKFGLIQLHDGASIFKSIVGTILHESDVMYDPTFFSIGDFESGKKCEEVVQYCREHFDSRLWFGQRPLIYSSTYIGC